jgi:CDP-diglyceride synthetase
LILITAVVACDITAYFAGVLFGKHKMAPVISPKKSWEGAIIGSITAASIVILFVFLFSLIPYKEIQHVATGSMNVPYNFFGVQFQNHFDNTYLQKAW